MATAMAVVLQNIASEICLIDANEKLVTAEAKDMQHGCIFLGDPSIYGSTDFKLSKGSAVCIVAAGRRPKQGQTQLDLLHTNINIFSKIIPKIIRYSTRTRLIIITEPCDVLSYAAWKLSGIPKERIMGAGTHLDTARFRYFIAQRLGVSPTSVNGYIIGEHGVSSVPLWSTVSVGGTTFSDLSTGGDTVNWDELHKKVIKADYEVSEGKGYNKWAIGFTAASLLDMILNDRDKVACVSTLAKNHQGVSQNVFLSLPVVIGSNGVTSFVNLKLTDRDQQSLCKSADVLDKVTRSIDKKLPSSCDIESHVCN